MSLPTLTPDALQSEARPFEGRAWRLVEAQHRVSTFKLVDSLAEQQALEEILEDVKPDVPDDCRHLDYLLSTPFRYRPYPQGSRFRRAGLTPGVWYGTEHAETAAAEMVFYRFLFYAESPQTPFPDNAAVYTAICAALSTPTALDLTSGLLALRQVQWTDLTDCEPCQALAETAREIGTEVIRYRSVRDGQGGIYIAVLSGRAFALPQPVERQTWLIRIGKSGAQVVCEHPRQSYEFAPNDFQNDPRLWGMIWDRPRVR